VATIYSHSLGSQRIRGTVTLLKELMGNKTVFTREASERKDLDVLQVFITPKEPFQAPVGLKVDVEFEPAQ
jgi:HlyD family secretion protein